LDGTELSWLTRHLGHSRAVHFQYYRGQEQAIELTKIAKLLFAVEKGSMDKFRGRTLDEIDLNGNMLIKWQQNLHSRKQKAMIIMQFFYYATWKTVSH